MNSNFVKSVFGKMTEYGEWNAKVEAAKTEYKALQNYTREKQEALSNDIKQRDEYMERNKKEEVVLKEAVDVLKKQKTLLQSEVTEMKTAFNNLEDLIKEANVKLARIEFEYDERLDSFNNQVEAHNKTIGRLETEIGNLETARDSIHEYVENLKEETKVLVNQLLSLEENAKALAKKENDLHDKEILINRKLKDLRIQ